MDEKESERVSTCEASFELESLLKKVILALKNNSDSEAEKIVRDSINEKFFLETK